MDDLEYPKPIHMIVGVDREISETYCLAKRDSDAFWNDFLRNK